MRNEERCHCPYFKDGSKRQIDLLLEVAEHNGAEHFTIYADSWAENSIRAEHLIARGVTILDRGVWLEENSRPKSTQFICSACGAKAYAPQANHTKKQEFKKDCPYKYCPNCGARMKGANDEQR